MTKHDSFAYRKVSLFCIECVYLLLLHSMWVVQIISNSKLGFTEA